MTALQQYLDARGESQNHFAKRANVDQKTINNTCRGLTTPTGETARRIIQATRRAPTPNGKSLTYDDLF